MTVTLLGTPASISEHFIPVSLPLPHPALYADSGIIPVQEISRCGYQDSCQPQSKGAVSAHYFALEISSGPLGQKPVKYSSLSPGWPYRFLKKL